MSERRDFGWPEPMKTSAAPKPDPKEVWARRTAERFAAVSGRVAAGAVVVVGVTLAGGSIGVVLAVVGFLLFLDEVLS